MRPVESAKLNDTDQRFLSESAGQYKTAGAGDYRGEPPEYESMHAFVFGHQVFHSPGQLCHSHLISATGYGLPSPLTRMLCFDLGIQMTWGPFP